EAVGRVDPTCFGYESEREVCVDRGTATRPQWRLCQLLPHMAAGKGRADRAGGGESQQPAPATGTGQWAPRQHQGSQGTPAMTPPDVDRCVAVLENLRLRIEMGGDISSDLKRPERMEALDAAIRALRQG